jgi:hypothetical protein
MRSAYSYANDWLKPRDNPRYLIQVTPGLIAVTALASRHALAAAVRIDQRRS